MNYLARYRTISIPESVKKILEKAKGNENWGTFLLKLYREHLKMKKILAFKKLRELLTENDLRGIEKSMKDFRKNFKLG